MIETLLKIKKAAHYSKAALQYDAVDSKSHLKKL